MKTTKKTITQSEAHELEAFLFAFPLEQWTSNTVFNYYVVKEKQLCKICDKWVKVVGRDRHIKSHSAQWLQLVDERREEAKRKRIEALKLSREHKKENNAA